VSSAANEPFKRAIGLTFQAAGKKQSRNVLRRPASHDLAE
jgi:hypothetical protein